MAPTQWIFMMADIFFSSIENILTYKRVKLHIQINTLSPLGVE